MKKLEELKYISASGVAGSDSVPFKLHLVLGSSGGGRLNEELLVLDLVHFGPPNTTEEKNEMDLHLKVSKYGLDELLVHPIMQACLDIKWNMFSKTYWLTMTFDLLFAIILTLTGNYFVNLTHCHPCNGTETDWSMKKFICMNISNCSDYTNCIKAGLKCEKGFLL